MIKTTLLFEISLAVLLALLKWVEYSFFIKDLTLEAYMGIAGGICVLLGRWMGWKLTYTHKENLEEIKTSLVATGGTASYDPNKSPPLH